MMFGYDGSHLGVAGWTAMAFGAAASWLVLAGVVIWTVRALSDTTARPSDPRRESPAEALAGRFARGEIDEVEYAARSRILRERGF